MEVVKPTISNMSYEHPSSKLPRMSGFSEETTSRIIDHFATAFCNSNSTEVKYKLRNIPVEDTYAHCCRLYVPQRSTFSMEFRLYLWLELSPRNIAGGSSWWHCGWSHGSFPETAQVPGERRFESIFWSKDIPHTNYWTKTYILG